MLSAREALTICASADGAPPADRLSILSLGQQRSVQGLRIASSLWTTAGVGLATGGGFYPLASVLLAAILIVQFPLRWAEDLLGQRIRSLPPLPSPWLLRMQGSPSGSGAALGTLSRGGARTPQP